MVEILDAPAAEADPEAADQQAAAIGAVRDLPYAAWVTIQMGCDNSCAFCIVPVGAGRRGVAGRSTTWSPKWRRWPTGG